MEYKEKKIYCPECGRLVYIHDGRGTLALSKRCLECGKIINYNPQTGLIKTVNVPARKNVSGKRFW